MLYEQHEQISAMALQPRSGGDEAVICCEPASEEAWQAGDQEQVTADIYWLQASRSSVAQYFVKTGWAVSRAVPYQRGKPEQEQVEPRQRPLCVTKLDQRMPSAAKAPGNRVERVRRVVDVGQYADQERGVVRLVRLVRCKVSANHASTDVLPCLFCHRLGAVEKGQRIGLGERAGNGAISATNINDFAAAEKVKHLSHDSSAQMKAMIAGKVSLGCAEEASRSFLPFRPEASFLKSARHYSTITQRSLRATARMQ